MDIAFLLITNIIPLYILIALGWISGRFLDVNLPSMATIAIYILAPFVNFGAMVKLDFDWHYIALPIFLFTFSGLIGIVTYHLAGKAWKNNSANLIAMGSVSGNTGYFGLPLVLVLFGPEWAGLYLFMSMSVLLNEVGLGYYFGARGNADMKGALKRVIKLPVIHGIWLGFAFNAMDVTLPDVVSRYWTYASGAWIIIGMMLIGVALSKQSKIEMDIRLMRWMFTPKFIVWPLGGLAFIMADIFWLQSFGPVIHQLLLIFTTVPLAGNLVAYAATLNLHPERAASAVLVSTLLAITTVPLALFLYQILT